MKKLVAAIVALCLIASFAFAQDDPVTLRLAVADAEGRPSTTFVLEFTRQVETLSDGNLTIKPVWDAGGDTFASFETGVVQLVLIGKFELGLAGSRAFDTVGITNFQALQAPFLITDDALAEAVATSDIAARTLSSVLSSGITGLALWPEDLRHPFAIMPGQTILSPGDFAGLNVRATPSFVTYMLLETLRATPMFDGSGYQAAESGLRQGFSLTGTPTATGNIVFFPKFQVLFAHGEALERLSQEQQTVLRDAAAATQEKAITEHPREVDAAAQWCADGGTILLASEEQVAAFEEAARPIFDLIEQDPLNAELIAAIRELKASTEPAPGAEACAPTTTQQSPEASAATEVWSEGLPPDGVWQVELGTEEFMAMGVMRLRATDWAGVYTLTLQDGQAVMEWNGEHGGSERCGEVTYAVIEDFVRFAFPNACGDIDEDLKWRLEEDGLHFHVVATRNSPFIETKALYEAKPWQKVD